MQQKQRPLGGGLPDGAGQPSATSPGKVTRDAAKVTRSGVGAEAGRQSSRKKKRRLETAAIGMGLRHPTVLSEWGGGGSLDPSPWEGEGVGQTTPPQRVGNPKKEGWKNQRLVHMPDAAKRIRGVGQLLPEPRRQTFPQELPSKMFIPMPIPPLNKFKPPHFTTPSICSFSLMERVAGTWQASM